MALTVKSLAVTTQKWQQNSGQAVTAYKDAVNQSGQKWQTGVDGAEGNWSAGVAAAAGNHAFTHGVNGKASVYVQRSIELGAVRYQPGITAGVPKYSQNMGKVLGIEAGLSLPPRGPVGSNMGRSQFVADALHQAKLQGQTR